MPLLPFIVKLQSFNKFNIVKDMSLQAGAVTLAQDLPDNVIMDQSNYRTTSDAVLNKRLIEISPINQTAYTATGSNEIVINIASNTSFIDWENTYLHGDLQILNSTAAKAIRSLERNGIHSLFSSVELRVASTSSTVERLESYNLFTAMEDSLIYAPDDLDQIFIDEFKSANEGYIAPDKDFDEIYRASPDGGFFTSTETITASGFGTINITASSTNADAYQLFREGDELLFGRASGNINLYGGTASYNDTTGVITLASAVGSPSWISVFPIGATILINNGSTTKIGTVSASSATTITVAGSLFGSNQASVTLTTLSGGSNSGVTVVQAIISTTQINVFPPIDISTPFVLIRRRGCQKSIRRAAAEGSATASTTVSTRFAMKLRLGFMRQMKWFPLFLLPRGFDLVLRLDPNLSYRAFRLSTTYADGDDPSFTCTVNNVRLNAMMIDCHSSVNAEYLSVFKSPKGILIPYISYVFNQKILETTAGLQVADLNTGVRSARHILGRLITDTFYNGDTKTSRRNLCFSVYPSLGLQHYQLTTGSLQFPLHEIDISDAGLYPMQLKRWQKITYKKNCDRDMTSHDQPFAPYGLAGNCLGVREMNLGDWLLKPENSTPGAAVNGGQDMSGCLLVMDLTRDVDGRFCGVDTSVQPLRVELEFGSSLSSTLGSARILHTFVAADTYAFLSESQGFNRLN
jgi:hypothetical protein